MEDKKEKSGAELLGNLTGIVLSWFVSAGFIYWGWTILAPHLNAPMFSFWEVFAIRMAFSSVMKIFWQRVGN